MSLIFDAPERGKISHCAPATLLVYLFLPEVPLRLILGGIEFGNAISLLLVANRYVFFMSFLSSLCTLDSSVCWPMDLLFGFGGCGAAIFFFF